MKNLIVFVFSGYLLMGCNTSSTNNTTSDTISTTTSETGKVDTVVGPGPTYNPAEGDVTYRNSKLMVRQNDQWVEPEKDVTLDSDIVVYRTGRVKRGNREIVLEDSQVVSRSGNIFDKTGRALDDAWDATKKGVNDAANAVKKAAKKVGDKTDDVIHDSTHR